MKHPFLELRSLCKAYTKRKKVIKNALKGVSFSIKEGEIFGLLGVNGAGKTTLSGILAGLHPPTSGDLLWKGKSIYNDLLKYRSMVGFCPQKPNIDPDLTIEETIVFAGLCYGKSKSQAEKQKDHLIELLKLGSYASSVAGQLSGGYKQRFLIARTMAHDPRFIILDEPTVGLDTSIRQNLWEIVKSLKKEGVTVLLTTHYLEEAEKLSDRVCFIHDGEMQVLDTPKNLNKHYKKENLEDVFLHLMKQNPGGDV